MGNCESEGSSDWLNIGKRVNWRATASHGGLAHVLGIGLEGQKGVMERGLKKRML